MPCPLKPEIATKIKDANTEKGSVHWFNLDLESNPSISSQKARPYIIIGRNNRRSSRVIISPISDRENYVEIGSDKLKYPYHVSLSKSEYPFLDKDSVILLDQVYTIGKDELCEEWYMGKITNLKDLDCGISYNYDLFESTFTIYKELFEELNSKFEEQHMTNYSRK